MRKNYPPQFKAKVVQEILREEKSLSELSSEHSVHITQLRKWKAKAIEELPNIFSKERPDKERIKQLEADKDQLYSEIGKLTTQLSWLKKKGIVIE